MEVCLITNEVCSNQMKKCKVCKLDDCRRTIEMIETQEDREDKWKRKLIETQLPEQCKDCSFLQVIDLSKQIVYCPYMIKDRCILK